MVIEVSEPGRVLMLGLAESQTKLAVTFVVAVELQMRAPMGKWRGPEVGLLLSRPITFQVRGVTARDAAASPEASRLAADTAVRTIAEAIRLAAGDRHFRARADRATGRERWKACSMRSGRKAVAI